MTFYVCNHCGNIITKLEDKGAPVSCCGEKMAELVPNTTDAAKEKHVPVISISGSTVTIAVGSADHPMDPDHFIGWVVLETTDGCQMKKLTPGSAPRARFALAEGDKVIAAYAYCNKHGLWKATL